MLTKLKSLFSRKKQAILRVPAHLGVLIAAGEDVEKTFCSFFNVTSLNELTQKEQERAAQMIQEIENVLHFAKEQNKTSFEVTANHVLIFEDFVSENPLHIACLNAIVEINKRDTKKILKRAKELLEETEFAEFWPQYLFFFETTKNFVSTIANYSKLLDDKLYRETNADWQSALQASKKTAERYTFLNKNKVSKFNKFVFTSLLENYKKEIDLDTPLAQLVDRLQFLIHREKVKEDAIYRFKQKQKSGLSQHFTKGNAKRG